MTFSKPKITLYKQAKEGLKSLSTQTAQVSIGLIVMLVATGGNPPGWLVFGSFILGVGFVAWSENKRQSRINSETPIKEENNILTLKKSVVIWNLQRKVGLHKIPNFSSADLSGADLFDADLSGADLIYANLSGADLIHANFSDANLIHANFSDANVNQAKFGNNQGLDDELRQELIDRGAIFVDSPEDPAKVLVRR